MTLTGISNRGLALIAVLVATLWGCIFAERMMVRQAIEETELVLRSRPVLPVNYRNPAPEYRRDLRVLRADYRART